ncbi:MAG TPA: hypothetical protein PLZ93_23980 [Nocardioides sp.]|uniref:hypothetical protein n=1 Tax=uncultured Nocardioides sp. TaxID=198441 RepID=UPI000EB95B64|nr:hypothetical protein [uncultured Nocardioides sp.]HCB07590.1 hypothetical protein [Nocardioides sp.]HRD60171.1 hypothetical protein [Nocardioides sp.]HRI98708.1 hypothetical protein [Nocardioides sp.]
MFSTVFSPAARLVRTQFLGLLALVIVLTGGAAYAATAAKNSVNSKSIKNGTVQTVDLKNGAVTTEKLALDSVTSDQVKANSLTGADINESTLGAVPNAQQLGGVPAADYLRGAVYKTEAATDAGTTLGDGTSVKAQACDAGDILLSGGPASLNATTDLIESFPTPGSTNSWSARVDKNGVGDNWTVVILCLDSNR